MEFRYKKQVKYGIVGWMKFIYGCLLLVSISVAAFWFFPDVINQTLPTKPNLYLIPELKQSPDLVDSFPTHNQFLAATPTVVKLTFAKEILTYTGKVSFGNLAIQKNILLDDTKKTLIMPLDSQSQNGIYQVNYSVCFSQNNCFDGQFAYKIDISKISDFANYSDNSIKKVKVLVSEKGLEPKNILINKGTQVEWESADTDNIRITGSTYSFAANKEASSSNVLGVTSTAETFITPGEYKYIIEGKPDLLGRILVQK